MRRNAKYSLVAGVLLALLVGAWFLFSAPALPPRGGTVDAAEIKGSGVLDGMTFSGLMGASADGEPVDDVGEPVDDTFIFANGTFMSTECDRRCGYPARPYFVRNVGDKIEFFSESSCLYKDASIVWRGTVENGTISGVSSWTVKRWYWTVEKEIPFQGTLSTSAGSVANNQ